MALRSSVGCHCTAASLNVAPEGAARGSRGGQSCAGAQEGSVGSRLQLTLLGKGARAGVPSTDRVLRDPARKTLGSR